MSQLIKHYWIDRDTGTWSINNKSGLQMPNIDGLEIKHNILDENDIPCFLSVVPDHFDKDVIISPEEFEDYQNNTDITILSYEEKQIEVFVSQLRTRDESSYTELTTVYEVTYREPYILEESDGLKILTQEQWDSEILSFDSRQIEKRYNFLRLLRDKLLNLTDWLVIKEIETNQSVTPELRDWRQLLRDIPNSDSFPLEFPAIPLMLQGNVELYKELQSLYGRFEELRNIPMIDDPLPALEPNPDHYHHSTYI